MFDYKTICTDKNFDDVMTNLKELGKEGWELVCSCGNKLILKRSIDDADSNDENQRVVVCKYGGWCDFKRGQINKSFQCTKTFKDLADMCQSAEVIELGEISHVE